MTAAPPLPDSLPDPSAERSERHQRLLAAMLERGERILRRVDEAAEAEAAHDLEREELRARIYDRVCRSMRRNMALEERLAETGRIRAREAARARADHRAAVQTRKDEIRGNMVEAIDTPDRPVREMERLWEKLDDWIERNETDEAFLDGPVYRQVQDICEAFEIEVDWVTWRTATGDLIWVIETHRDRLMGSYAPPIPEHQLQALHAARAAMAEPP